MELLEASILIVVKDSGLEDSISGDISDYVVAPWPEKCAMAERIGAVTLWLPREPWGVGHAAFESFEDAYPFRDAPLSESSKIVEL